MRCSARILVCVVMSIYVGSAYAATTATVDTTKPSADDQSKWFPLGLQSYEPSALGYTKFNDDVWFANLKLSVKFPIAPKLSEEYWHGVDKVFFSFTGYWGFYFATRPSGPVVGKEYNPQLFWQHNLRCQGHSEDKYRPNAMYGASPPPPASSEKDSSTPGSGTDDSRARTTPQRDLNCYWALGYNHDSNGQIINSPGQYAETVRDQGVEAANDAISRGWDYIRATGRWIPYWTEDDRVTLYPTLKYFLNDGLLQGKPEELHYWENPTDGKSRNEVDGLSLLAKYQRNVAGFDAKLAVEYTTGYKDPFKFSTVRLEAGIVVFELPIVFWMQSGYMSDLAQYYRYVKGYGVQVEIGAF